MRRLVPLLLLFAACSSPSAAPVLRHLDRPTDVTFACLGFSTPEGVRALPPESCKAVVIPEGEPDAGVTDAATVSTIQLAFVIE